MKRILVGITTISVLAGCAKTEGEGGNAKIQGNVYAIDYVDENSTQLDTFPASEEDIYIIYGDNDAVDDKVTTNQDGYFCFDYLRKGTYTILAYTKDPEEGDVKFPVERTIEIEERKGEYTVEDIYIYKPSVGVCAISGNVFAINFANDLAIKPDTTAGLDETVYISYAGSEDYFDKQTTNADGVFTFSYLRHGSYVLTAYTRDPDNGGTKVAVNYNVEIPESTNTVSSADFYLYKSDEGYATISGQLYEVKYGSTTTVESEYYLPGENVFIRQKGSTVVIDKVESGDDGAFMFARLPVGTYEVYALSETSSGPDELSIKEVQITKTGQDVTSVLLRILNY